MNRSISISVIIPSYNRAAYLPRALDSVLAQTYSCDECIVVDDGSTDNTKHVLINYPTIKSLSHPTRRGVSAARNFGLAHAKGEWIGFLDSDDVWMPHKLQRQMAVIQSHSKFRWMHTEEWWYRGGVRVNPMKKHQKKGGRIYLHCLPRCMVSPSCVLIHRSVFERVGVFDESLPACEDYDLWLRIAAVYPIYFEPTACVIKHGGHDDQLSRQYWGMDRFRVEALKKQLDSVSLSQQERDATREQLKQKLSILLLGAKKRQHQQAITHYQQQLATYE